MSTEALRQVFKTLADPTRLRLLLLLEREELAVHELMAVIDLAQSTVSRHLAVLREAGLLRDRREGTFVYYRLVPPDGAWREVWRVAKRALLKEPTAARDRAALDKVLDARAVRTKSWFDSVAAEWDSLRRLFDDDVHRARAIGRLVPKGVTVADIGTGTGVLAVELARAGLRVIAVDHSRKMLDAARAKIEAAGIEGIELRRGDAGSLPIGDGEVQAAFAHMVLHYLPSPADAVREMARVVAPGGRIVVVDFVQHDRTWMRERLGVLWQGFPLETVCQWFERVDLATPDIEVDQPAGKGNDIPATFIAAAQKPGKSVTTSQRKAATAFKR